MSKYYKVDVQGKNWLQRVPDVSALVHVASDEGRIAYDELTETLYFADSSNFVSLGGSIPAGTIMLLEADTSVAGFTLLTNKDDRLIYVTKGSGAGGETGGTDKAGSTWSQDAHDHTTASHSHSLGTHTHGLNSHTHTSGAHVHPVGDHNHQWHDYDYNGGNPILHTWDSGGSNLSYSWGSDDDTQFSGEEFGDIHTSSRPLAINAYTDASTGNTDTGSGNTGGPSTANTIGPTGSSDSGGGADTGSTVPPNTWRPRGRNFTRQQKD